jgi:hypothetical protein
VEVPVAGHLNRVIGGASRSAVLDEPQMGAAISERDIAELYRILAVPTTGDS